MEVYSGIPGGRIVTHRNAFAPISPAPPQVQDAAKLAAAPEKEKPKGPKGKGLRQGA